MWLARLRKRPVRLAASIPRENSCLLGVHFASHGSALWIQLKEVCNVGKASSQIPHCVEFHETTTAILSTFNCRPRGKLGIVAALGKLCSRITRLRWRRPGLAGVIRSDVLYRASFGHILISWFYRSRRRRKVSRKSRETSGHPCQSCNSPSALRRAEWCAGSYKVRGLSGCGSPDWDRSYG